MHSEDPFIKALHVHRHEGSRLHHDSHQAHEMFQTSMMSALLEGVYDGDLSYQDLSEHGDFGLGTFNALDGEMIAFGGEFFQIRSNGQALPVDMSLQTPFAVITSFQPDMDATWDEPTSYEEFQKDLDRAVPTKNLFYAIRIEGFFEYIKARSVPRQEKPYPPMVEVVKSQPIFEFQDVRGTMVGFRFPDYTRGINIPGYHLHFISEDRTVGGHVIDFQMHGVKIEIDHTSNLHMELPDEGDFLTADLGKDNAEAIRKTEQ